METTALYVSFMGNRCIIQTPVAVENGYKTFHTHHWFVADRQVQIVLIGQGNQDELKEKKRLTVRHPICSPGRCP